MQLSFSVVGSFINDLATNQFLYENRSYEEVKKLLLSCMQGTDESEEVLEKHVQDVLLGRAKFSGNTSDGSFCLLELEEYPTTLFNEFNKMQSKIVEFEKLQKDYTSLRTYLDAYVRLGKESADEFLDDLCEEDRNILKPASSSFSEQLDSFIRQWEIEDKFPESYGWIDPRGQFYPVDWGDHQKWAYGKSVELGYIDSEQSVDLYNGGDVLTERGWVLLHNPSRGIPQIQQSQTKRMTKAQKEFLYKYFTDRGLDEQANEVIDDES